ncbi:hypothetical protein IB265_34875 [Ensifer sp. ENS10]|uniref:hypothetical protein n=1 Tax=Ensifer sp. ENS10 TaxID=2769286 RepID=UPI00177EC266|nr:hypothetical protein [Ensifer sp. ENS10]MBD9511936.1 hypothetical protein [Ensifer sp. ENS10]
MATKVEVGDLVVVRGEVVWIDDDGVPRVEFRGAEYPVRISSGSFESVTKPTKRPIYDKPD